MPIRSGFGLILVILSAAGCGRSDPLTKNSSDIEDRKQLLILPGTATSGGVVFGSGSVSTLMPEDADAIARKCPAVKAAAIVIRARAQVVHASKSWVPVYLYGTTPDFLTVRDWTDLEEGKPFTDADVRNEAMICLIGQSLKRELFNNESPVGKEVRINSKTFKVVGVLGRKGSNMMGADQDDIMLVPWRTLQKVASTDAGQLYPGQQTGLYPDQSPTQHADIRTIDQILVLARSPEAIRQITDLLRERHHIKPGQPDDFHIRDMTEMAKPPAPSRR